MQHDYIRFKEMSGNEILFNMENYHYFRPTEIMGSLSALSHIPEQINFKWETHPYVSGTLDRLIELMPQFKKNQLIQSLIIFDRLRIKSESNFH